MPWFLALAFGGVAAGIALKAPEMLYFSRVHWQVLFPVGFAATGLAFLVGALIATARWLRFSRCRVRMASVPGVIGGHFRGEVLLPATFPSMTDVRLELCCQRTTTTSTSGSDHDHVSVQHAWTHTLRVTTNAAIFRDSRSVIPFDFTVPYGLPDETDSRRESPQTRTDIQWRLRVFARLHGPDLDITYRVPVFRTAASDPAVTGETGGAKDLDTILRDRGEQRRVRYEDVQGVPTLICDARGMNKGLSVVPAIIGLVMLAMAVVIPCNALPSLARDILKRAAGWDNLAKLFPLAMALGTCLMMTVLGLFGLLFLFLGLHGLVSRRTWIRNGMVHQRLRLLGIPWTRNCLCSSVTGVNTGDRTSSGGRTWYSVVIERNTATQHARRKAPWLYLFSRMTVATNVPAQGEAEEMVARLRHDLGLPGEADGSGGTPRADT